MLDIWGKKYVNYDTRASKWGIDCSIVAPLRSLNVDYTSSYSVIDDSDSYAETEISKTHLRKRPFLSTADLLNWSLKALELTSCYFFYTLLHSALQTLQHLQHLWWILRCSPFSFFLLSSAFLSNVKLIPQMHI